MNQKNILAPPRPCLLCGRCMSVCPVFRVTCREDLSPRGKAFLLRSFEQIKIDSRSVEQLACLCAGCGRCKAVCPQKLNLPQEIALLKSRHPSWKSWMWSRIIRSQSRILPLAKNMRHIIPGSIPFIRTALKTKEPAPVLVRLEGPAESSSPGHGPASVFPGCTGRYLRPFLEEQAQRILNLAGYDVISSPNWQCCGYPLGSAGLLEQQSRETEKNIQTWDTMGNPAVFAFCATCMKGLGHFNAEAAPAERAVFFRNNVHALPPVLKSYKAYPADQSCRRDIYWHSSCHGSADTREIFEQIFSRCGFSFRSIEDKCCGMGGAFAIQSPDLSLQISADFWQSVDIDAEIGPIILTDCSGCALQLEATRPEQAVVAHWLEVIGFD